MKGKLGQEWVKAEAAKASEQKHQLIHWALHLFEYQNETIKNAAKSP